MHHLRRLVRAGATKTERLAARALFIPKEGKAGAVNVHFRLEHTNGSALYTYESAGRFYAITFWGAAVRPFFHYVYRTEAQRTAAVLEFKAKVEASVEYKAKRATEKAAWVNPLKVGDILHTCWGYDQTNVEFFAVTKVSGRKIHLREIAQETEATGFMSGNCWPKQPIEFIGEELTRLAQPSGQSVRVKITESADAWPVDGRQKFGYSSYA